MATEPLTPQEIDALLRPDPRTTSADLFVLRDALRRLGDAWERLANAAGQLEDAARALEQRGRGGGASQPARPAADVERSRPAPPRAD
jgi:hypothetical protein